MPSDPRIIAFYRLINAIDGSHPREGIATTRELRRLGLSVVLIRPDGRREGR